MIPVIDGFNYDRVFNWQTEIRTYICQDTY
jgi:hypothetical protein